MCLNPSEKCKLFWNGSLGSRDSCRPGKFMAKDQLT